jgi:transposase
MKDVNLYLKVRHAVRIEGLSERAAARRFGIDPRTVNKMMRFSVPPGGVTTIVIGSGRCKLATPGR